MVFAVSFLLMVLFTRTFLARLINRIPGRDWYLLFFGVPVCWSLHNFLVASRVGRYVEIIGEWF